MCHVSRVTCHTDCGHLHVTVDEPVQLEVIIVLAEGVDQGLGHLEPAHEEGELQREEHRVEQIQPHTLQQLWVPVAVLP